LAVVHRFAQYLEWVSLALITILPACRYANLANYSEPVRPLIKFLADWAFPLVIYFALGLIATKGVQQFTGRRTAHKQEIKHILDLIHKTYFRDRPEQEHYQHRVTAFKACKTLIRRRQYLKIFSRSGSIHLNSRTRLPIDSEHEAGNEGVAAWAWYTDAQLIRRGLPEWPQNPNPSHEKDPVCQEYARLGLMSVNLAARLRIKSRSLGATVVRNQAGDKWGALVLDSRDPQGVSDAPEKKDLLTLCADLLTPHL
jgi:hypothetical protein